jgi:hypothetical protein
MSSASAGQPASTFVEVSVGAAGREFGPLRAWEPTRAEWTEILRVRVVTNDSKPDQIPAVAGRYALVDGDLRFTPLFPFEPGRRLMVTFDPGRLAALEAGGAAAPRSPLAESLPVAPITTVLVVPADPKAPAAAPTVVARVTPSGERVPENLLRLYVHFSAPMGMRGGREFVHLLDEGGKEVAAAFLPVEAEFWNEDRTRYTLFLDPGRVKRGVRPNEEMGRSLEAGRTYTLLVDAAWPDAHGRPLAQPFRKTFHAGAAIEKALSIADWQVTAPREGTRDPLIVAFPHALDDGLLLRALGVETRAGAAIAGTIRVEHDERRWLFVPRDAWHAGDHQLVVLTILEDPSGNRIGRAFEMPESPKPGSPLAAAASRSDEPARVTRAFHIGSAAPSPSSM